MRVDCRPYLEQDVAERVVALEGAQQEKADAKAQLEELRGTVKLKKMAEFGATLLEKLQSQDIQTIVHMDG